MAQDACTLEDESEGMGGGDDACVWGAWGARGTGNTAYLGRSVHVRAALTNTGHCHMMCGGTAVRHEHPRAPGTRV